MTSIVRTAALAVTFSVSLLAQADAAAARSQAAADQTAALRVLLVGHDPAAPKVSFKQLAKERTYRLYRERTAAFEALLRYHFEHVEVVHGEDYVPAMSDRADVTIFDCRPKALRPMQREPEYRAAEYLPADFDAPAIMISENSPWIGEPLGTKFDWL